MHRLKSDMVGIVIALVATLVVIVTMFITFRAARACHEGTGGLLCKIWHKTA
jgi:hypothetical protein